MLTALHLETGLGTQRNYNLAAIRGKLIGIAQEVVHYLAHLIHIHRHVQLREFRFELQRHLVVGKDTEGSTDIIHETHYLRLRKIQLLLVLVELAEVENLVHQIEQTGGVAMNQLQLSALGRVGFFSYHRHQRRDDEGERSAELMAHVGEEVQLQLVQFLGLLHTVFHALALKLITLAFYHSATVEEEGCGYQGDIYQECPDREIERWSYVDFQLADLVVHGSVAVHHLHLQDIAARREIGEGYLRTVGWCEQPLVGDSLHAIEEAVARWHRHFAGSQLDGEGIVLIAQIKTMAGIKRLLQNHPAFILLACRQGMIEENHAAEERTHMVLGILCRTGTDDIHTILSADGDVAIAHQACRAIVKLALLQAIQRIIVGYLQVPFAFFILIYLHMGNHKL